MHIRTYMYIHNILRIYLESINIIIIILIGAVKVTNENDFDISTYSTPVIGNVQCDGNEDRLQDCYIREWNIDMCPNESYAGAICRG